MKLMFIIAGDEYAADISEKLKEHAFMATEVGSTGDFLQYGQTVLLLGVNEQDCDRILSILDPEADWKGTEPVSYTHLDVYKRQPSCCRVYK